jgi:hypothetical protein
VPSGPDDVTDLRALRRDLTADCARCRALCCVAPAFARSADFPITKPAGVPCPNLLADQRCGIHDRLRDTGFRGCVGYDCFGAGQRLSAGEPALPRPAEGRRADPLGAADVFAALPVLRLLHELLWYLTEVLATPAAHAVHPQAQAAADATRLLAGRAARDLRLADAEALRRSVAPVLRRASDLVRAAGGGAGPDHAGADLAGRDLRRADLRRACLRGTVLLGADLRRADLRGADLLGADTRDARLHGADLGGALFLTRTQVDAADGDRSTRLPRWLDHPAHWRA